MSTPLSTQPRKTITVGIPEGLVERARNAVWHTPGATFAGLCADALELHLRELEEVNGGAFPQRDSELRTGRRPS